MKILILTLALLLLLCGCSGNKGYESESTYDGYAAEYLDYKPAKSADFSLAGAVKTLSLGEQIGNFTLTNLLTRQTDEGEVNVRADFTTDVTVVGKVRYNKSTTYKNILQFYPPDANLFPRVAGDTEPLSWLIIREDNSPLSQLGIEVKDSIEKDITVKITAFSINYTQHSTTNYITVEIVK